MRHHHLEKPSMPASYLASLNEMRRSINAKANSVSTSSSKPQLVDHLTSTGEKNFTGIKFLRDSVSSPLTKTWPGSQPLQSNEVALVSQKVCTRDWVESCLGSWLGKEFDSELNERQMKLMKVQNKKLPFNKPRACGGYNRVWRSRVAKLAIQDLMARKLQACYRFYDVKRRMKLGGEFNVQKSLECFREGHFQEAITCLDTAQSYFRLQRNHAMLSEVDRLRLHMQTVHKAEAEMVRARVCMQTAEEPPLEIVRAVLDLAERLFLDLEQISDDDFSRLNEVYFLRAETDMASAEKLLSTDTPKEGAQMGAKVAAAEERVKDAERSLGSVKLQLGTHGRADRRGSTLKASQGAKNGHGQQERGRRSKRKPVRKSIRGTVKSRDHFMEGARGYKMGQQVWQSESYGEGGGVVAQAKGNNKITQSLHEKAMDRLRLIQADLLILHGGVHMGERRWREAIEAFRAAKGLYNLFDSQIMIDRAAAKKQRLERDLSRCHGEVQYADARALFEGEGEGAGGGASLPRSAAHEQAAAKFAIASEMFTSCGHRERSRAARQDKQVALVTPFFDPPGMRVGGVEGVEGRAAGGAGARAGEGVGAEAVVKRRVREQEQEQVQVQDQEQAQRERQEQQKQEQLAMAVIMPPRDDECPGGYRDHFTVDLRAVSESALVYFSVDGGDVRKMIAGRLRLPVPEPKPLSQSQSQSQSQEAENEEVSRIFTESGGGGGGSGGSGDGAALTSFGAGSAPFPSPAATASTVTVRAKGLGFGHVWSGWVERYFACAAPPMGPVAKVVRSWVQLEQETVGGFGAERLEMVRRAICLVVQQAPAVVRDARMIGIEIETVSGSEDSLAGEQHAHAQSHGDGASGGSGSGVGSGGGGRGTEALVDDAGDSSVPMVEIVFTVRIHELTEQAQREEQEAAEARIAAGIYTDVGKDLPVEFKDQAALDRLTRSLIKRLSDNEPDPQGDTGGAFKVGSMDESGASSRIVATVTEDVDAAKPFSQRFFECLKKVVDAETKRKIDGVTVETQAEVALSKAQIIAAQQPDSQPVGVPATATPAAVAAPVEPPSPMQAHSSGHGRRGSGTAGGGPQDLGRRMEQLKTHRAYQIGQLREAAKGLKCQPWNVQAALMDEVEDLTPTRTPSDLDEDDDECDTATEVGGPDDIE